MYNCVYSSVCIMRVTWIRVVKHCAISDRHFLGYMECVRLCLYVCVCIIVYYESQTLLIGMCAVIYYPLFSQFLSLF